ncbi:MULTISPECIES: type II toxin-antitoxin system RelE/ParE family toxin [Sphaerospermopsis]|uniref:Type II toxin-antitoxin system RelE/ParE family toxin n=1 Tax=Sphaerospermopsis torques-reginae ITEP-024 TaxID=984208 RepID=A0ABX8X3K7_9CYAN|nr:MULTISPECIES: type II toxin-antitoxin system RelE/ParE family toxin [Sphaerospermopsis]MBE9054791.1 type II toxin-antitoxin system RelE/ParE family toxin [Sphaerospermopsis sp. LEGE 08334]QYX33142.1 type II toxin-antitoxin system RelE/ParE family toxin [Sphaerospermopsis torques-reginae ITEP-024]
MSKEYIIYVGLVFQLEWYFDENGESEALEYFNQISEQQQLKFLFLVKRIGDFGKISNKEQFRNEGDKIYAFKPQPDRFLCFFFTGKKIIVTNAFQKKTQKLPNNQKEKAIKYMNDFIQRHEEGRYYEEE